MECQGVDQVSDESFVGILHIKEQRNVNINWTA